MSGDEILAEVVSACCKCGNLTAKADLLRIWDGKDYCKDCIPDSISKLESVENRFLPLEEKCPYTIKELLKRELPIVAIGVLVYTAFMMAMGTIMHDEQILTSLQFVALQLPIILPVLFLAAALRARRTVLGAASVRVEDGIIQTERRMGDQENHQLNECKWRVGKATEDSYLYFNTATPSRKVILIVSPNDRITAVGWTSSSFEIWEDFLQLSLGPHNLPKNKS